MSAIPCSDDLCDGTCINTTTHYTETPVAQEAEEALDITPEAVAEGLTYNLGMVVANTMTGNLMGARIYLDREIKRLTKLGKRL